MSEWDSIFSRSRSAKRTIFCLGNTKNQKSTATNLQFALGEDCEECEGGWAWKEPQWFWEHAVYLTWCKGRRVHLLVTSTSLYFGPGNVTFLVVPGALDPHHTPRVELTLPRATLPRKEATDVFAFRDFRKRGRSVEANR